MMEFLLLYISVALGGTIVGLCIVARDRRIAVDRLLRELMIVSSWKAPRGKGLDPPGRVIARSVKRMRKEKHERC